MRAKRGLFEGSHLVALRREATPERFDLEHDGARVQPRKAFCDRWGLIPVARQRKLALCFGHPLLKPVRDATRRGAARAPAKARARARTTASGSGPAAKGRSSARAVRARDRSRAQSTRS